MKADDKCLICDLGFLEKIIKDEVFIIEDKEIILSNVVAYHCKGGCGEIFIDNRNFKKTSRLLKEKKNEIISCKIKRND